MSNFSRECKITCTFASLLNLAVFDKYDFGQSSLLFFSVRCG